MLTSNVPQIQFTPTGVVAPTPQEVLDGVLADFNQAFGGELSLDLSTPQGQLATSLAAIITDKNNQIVFYVNQIDPQYAQGLFQDAIASIYFLKRKPGTTTKVPVVLGGIPGTIIPALTLAKDTSGNIYSCFAAITIQGDSVGMGVFENTQTGRIPCPANTLTKIYQSINGWDTINNPTDGILGSDVEDRAELEYRRNASVAINASGTLPALKGVVFAIPSILDVYVYDNVENTNLVIGGVTLVPHSLYICAYAQLWNTGLRESVANAIISRKNLGCNYNGDTTVTVLAEGNYYDVSFQEAIELDIYFEINITNNPNLPNNIAFLIQNAIFKSFDEKIGALIEGNNYYGIILAVNPLIQIISVFVGDAPAPSTINFQTEITQKPICLLNNIIVNLV